MCFINVGNFPSMIVRSHFFVCIHVLITAIFNTRLCVMTCGEATRRGNPPSYPSCHTSSSNLSGLRSLSLCRWMARQMRQRTPPLSEESNSETDESKRFWWRLALDSDLQCLQTDRRTRATTTCREPQHTLERGDTLDEDSAGRLLSHH